MRRRRYNPWNDIRKIEKCIFYGIQDSKSYKQILYHALYTGKIGSGKCRHCHKSYIFKITPIGYICRNCKKPLNVLIDTPMLHSNLPLFIWFDCIYMFMKGAAKEYDEAPIIAAIRLTDEYIAEKYKISLPLAHQLKVGCRDLVFPSTRGIWGDERRSEYKEDTSEHYDSFMNVLNAVVKYNPNKKQ